MTVLDRVLLELEKKNKNQLDLCNYLNISSGVFTNWKKRGTEPPTKYLNSIADFLGVSVNYLLTGSNITPSNSNLISKLTPNEEECLNLFRQLDDREQIKLIGKLEHIIELKYESQSIEYVARSLNDNTSHGKINITNKQIESAKIDDYSKSKL